MSAKQLKKLNVPLSRYVGQLRAELNSKQEELERLQRTVEDQNKNLALKEEELTSAQEANARAPTVTMKNMVDRLKKQLSDKEKQHQVYGVY